MSFENKIYNQLVQRDEESLFCLEYEGKHTVYWHINISNIYVQNFSIGIRRNLTYVWKVIQNI